jgi:hypothetical protein
MVAKSKSPVENGGKHPIIHRVENPSFGGAGFSNHPQYVWLAISYMVVIYGC